MLNLSKGPAVWGPRVQADSAGYPRFVYSALITAGVSIVEGMVRSLSKENGHFTAVNLEDGRSITGDAFVLATGTYLGGVLYRGGERWPGGRAGGLSSVTLDRFLSGLFHVERFKTGTSPRVVTGTVRTDALEVQSAHTFAFRFSLESDSPVCNHKQCHLARTNERTGRAILENLDRSPLYGKRIEGKGPRYCPSFETKVVKFPERHEHPVHLEPISRDSRLSYLNGLSTSMPQDVQYRMLRTLEGFKNVEIALFGYAVEYSRLSWGEFDMSLRLSGTENLFAAGQILGTSGYEEAAALGLLAGANAAKTAMELDCVVPDREESYLGVMVSDLVRKGIDEPYRLFSSRAENRLYIRQDNAHVRLAKLARDLGVLGGRRLSLVGDYLKQYEKAQELIRASGLEYLCRRPEAGPGDVMNKNSEIGGLNPECVETVFNDIKYGGYISRHTRRRKAAQQHWNLPVPPGFRQAGISIEARQAIETRTPETIREAAELPGVRASDLEVLTLLALKGRCST
jgi:tRNA uridine 5-carboxymethylaminomethyl modification enzyme